jgi:hypothetical protein
MGGGRPHSVRGSRVTFGNAQRLLDLLLAQPIVRRCEVPSEDGEDGYSAQDDRGKVERVGRHGEVERRDHDLRTVSEVEARSR